MKIVYVGTKSGTTAHRAAALARLGHAVHAVSPYTALPEGWRVWLYRAGGVGIDTAVSRHLARALADKRFDLALVDCGDVVGPASLAILRAHAPRCALYCADNPFNPLRPEARRWTILRRSLALYDRVVTVKRAGIEAAMRAAGVRDPLSVWQCADERVHAQPASAAEARYDLAFVGTWMPGRDRFCADLLEAGLAIQIAGPRWRKAPRFQKLRHRIVPTHLDDHAYGATLRAARLGLVLLNSANRDGHTKRSIEVPALGVAMVAPDTPAHRALYRPGRDAALFTGSASCIAQCKRLLNDETMRLDMARAGHKRVFANQTRNEVLMADIVAATLSPHGARDAS